MALSLASSLPPHLPSLVPDSITNAPARRPAAMKALRKIQVILFFLMSPLHRQSLHVHCIFPGRLAVTQITLDPSRKSAFPLDRAHLVIQTVHVGSGSSEKENP